MAVRVARNPGVAGRIQLMLVRWWVEEVTEKNERKRPL